MINAPRRSLASLPTPVSALPRLTELLGGPQLFIKRDDQTGLGLGGNKTRKLEFLVGEALAQGADTLVTAGAAQSNHCRQTAAAAAVSGLECHLLLGGSAPESVQGNLLLDQLFGAQIRWCGQHRKGEDLAEHVRLLEDRGRRPYVVPYGGSNAVGALGYVGAIHELVQQITEPMTHIIFASSSGGTQAGLMVGAAQTWLKTRLVGINIDKTGAADYADEVADLASRTADRIHLGRAFGTDEVTLRSDYLGEGYGIMGAAEREAMELTARHEGILLDPVYTGRAMAGLIGMIRAGEFAPDDRVLFWHTGGTPALFAYAEQLTKPSNQ